MEERRAEPTGAGKRKRQAVLMAREGVACIDLDEDADGGAPLQANAPSRARAGKQCEGRCAGGRQCGVWSVGSSAPAWISAPLRSGGRFCKTHEPRCVAARAAKATAKAARPSGGHGATRRAGVRPAAQGVRRMGAARRVAAANRGTAGMAAAIMAAHGK